MRAKNRKKSRLGILFLLPVFLLYVNHSLLIYHSHIYSNGTVITHAYPFNDCEKQQSDQDNQSGEKQIIVFQGLMLVLSHNPLPVFIMDDESDYFVKVSLPLVQNECSGFSQHKPGRAPPVFFS